MKTRFRSLGPPLARGILLATLALGGVCARAQNPNAPSWNPALQLPHFITHFVIDPKFLAAISKYRSNAGHGYADQYEWPDCSLKNYYQPLPQYLFAQNGQNTLPEYAPANGTINSITPDGLLSTGEPRGNQIAIVPDGYPQFTIVMFHVDPLANVAAGQHVTAGDQLGYADLREAINVDLAVSANWNATPMFVSPGVLPSPGQVLKAPGWRLLSPFDVMSDDAFAVFAPYGLTDRNAAIVPLAYRNLNPGQFAQWDPANLSPIEAIIFPVAPVIADQPLSVNVPVGYAASFRTYTAMTGTLSTYQWFKEGVAIPGATDFQFTIDSVQASDAGYYSVVLTTPGGSTTSAAAALTIYLPTPIVSRLVNLSIRAQVAAGGQLTAGFVMTGSGTKSLLLRGVGPSLGQFGVSGALADPTLALIPSGSSTALLSNARWIETKALDSATASVGAFPLVTGSADSAMAAALPVGGYSMRIASSVASDSGLALAEIYDADPDPLHATVMLKNLSALGNSGAGAAAMEAGFVITGIAPKQVLIRAVGPGLAKYGVQSPMADPQLLVFPQGVAGPPLFNDNWGDDERAPLLQPAFDAAGAFPLDAGSNDAAMAVFLAPGAYTVHVTSADGTAGNVLLEVYDLDPLNYF